MKIRYLYPALLLSAVALAGCNVNKDIDVPTNAHWSSGTGTISGEITVGAGATVDGGLRTINGAIHLGAGAQTGDLTSVNGNLSLAAGAHAGKLAAVNGGISLDKNSLITGDAATVNGDIRAASGAHVGGKLENVNGNMTLCGAEIAGNLDFYNGTVLLTDGATVQGGITAKKPKQYYGESGTHVVPILIVGPRASVGGTIRFERPGKLYVSTRAVIHGVQGVTATPYTGNLPAGVTLSQCAAD